MPTSDILTSCLEIVSDFIYECAVEGLAGLPLFGFAECRECKNV